MKYPELSKFDPETQQLIVDYLGKARLENLKSTSDFEKTFLVIVEDYKSKKLSLDDFSFLCGKLLLILEETENERAGKLEEFLLMGDDAEWYMKHDPQKGSEIIENIFTFTRDLKEKRTDQL